MKNCRSVFSFVLAFLLLFVQGILAVFRYWFQLEFNNPLLFYGINVGIVCLATLAIALISIAGFFSCLVVFCSFYRLCHVCELGTRSIASESPDGTHLLWFKPNPMAS